MSEVEFKAGELKMNIYDFVKTHKDENLVFNGFDEGRFYYYSEKLGLEVEIAPHYLNDCEFSNEETIMTLFEQLNYHETLNFTCNGKFIGGLTNGTFKYFLKTSEY